VTLTALAREVIGRRINGMTRLTIRKARVIEVRGCPATGVVTGAALAREVIGGFIGRVAGRAVGEAGVIGWRIDSMAHRAIGEASVIHGGRLPCIGRMTRAALTRPVIGGLIGCVAGCAVGETSVIEVGRLPRCS